MQLIYAAFHRYFKSFKVHSLVHSLASKYAKFVVLWRLMYWTPHQTTGPPLLKSDDLFLGNQEILDTPLSKILDTPLNVTIQKLPHIINNYNDDKIKG